MVRLGITVLSLSPLSPALALVASPQITWRYRWVPYCGDDRQSTVKKHLGSRRPVFYLAAAAAEQNANDGGDGRNQGLHSEQKAGFQPPSPLDDDGHRVDLSSLQDLLDSGEDIYSGISV